MSIRKFIAGSVAALTIVTGVAFGIGKVQAAQIPWTGENLPSIHTPVFNTYTDIPAGIGNEADFVKLRKCNGDPTVPAYQNNFIDPVDATCTVGEKFDVRTYIHNGADDDYNDNGNGSAVAHGVNVAMRAPLGTTSNKFDFTSTVSAANAASVVDTGRLNCGANVRLKLVPHTVKVKSIQYDWQSAPDSAVNGNLAIGSRVPGSGDQWGCWNDRVVVVYVVEVIPAPVTPPVYTCDALAATSLGDRRFSYTVRYTAKNGATFKNVSYDFGDKTAVVTTDKTTVEHTYAKDGQYTTKATVTFMVAGKEVTATSDNCATNVDAKTPPNNCPIPGKTNLPVNSPECVIPNTGAGEIIGLFAATTVAGAAAHHVFTSRRFGRQ
jgi:hypothetical protein